MFVVPYCAAVDAVKVTVWDPAVPAITAVTPAGALQPVIVSLGSGEAMVTGGPFGCMAIAPNEIMEPFGTEGTKYTYDCARQPAGVTELSVTYAGPPERMVTLELCADMAAEQFAPLGEEAFTARLYRVAPIPEFQVNVKVFCPAGSAPGVGLMIDAGRLG